MRCPTLAKRFFSLQFRLIDLFWITALSSVSVCWYLDSNNQFLPARSDRQYKTQPVQSNSRLTENFHQVELITPPIDTKKDHQQ